jgi:hypothetical protein
MGRQHLECRFFQKQRKGFLQGTARQAGDRPKKLIGRVEWELNRDSAPFGLSGAQWQSMRPELSPQNELVLAVWSFCRGWEPAAFALAFEHFGVADSDYMLEALSAMRERIDAHKALQRKP